MRRSANILQVTLFILLCATTASQAKSPWEVVAQSPGEIINAVTSPAGKISIMEQTRFVRSSSEALDFSAKLRYFSSAGGTKYASMMYLAGGEYPTAAKMTVYSESSAELWSLSQQKLNDLVLLESGGAVGMNRNINLPENQVIFFDQKGARLKEISIPALGEVKAALTGDRVIINSGTMGALLYNSAGEKIADLGSAYRTSFSDDGRWLAILNGAKLTIFHEGTPTCAVNLGGEIIRGAVFSRDNASVAAFTDHALFLLRNPDGQVVLQRQLDAAGQLSFTSIDISSRDEIIATGVERDLGAEVKGPERHPEGEVRLYDLSGGVIYSRQIAYSHWNTTTPRVKFSANGAQLMVLTRDEITLAEVRDLTGKGGVR
jgi:hypothetical protein